ncbi:MAG: S1-C subfamily serine protease [Verrucomicrobiales bacterium]|jgi:S1-C subfamily serine protease
MISSRIHFFIAAILGLLPMAVGLTAASAQNKSGPDATTSIVRVNVTNQRYNFGVPWQKQRPTSRRGLGAVLENNRVLVTAELIQDSNYVELEIASTGRKLTAKVEAVDYEVNLAVLVPAQDPGAFFEGIIPLEIADPAKVNDSLEVWQFESNGSPASTEVSLTRAEIGRYFLPDAYFLEYEVSGLVQYRSGSFTLPVVREGKLAGMLLSYNSDDQIADVLPSMIIQRFLDDVANPPYEGFPNFGIQYSVMLDDQFRSYLNANQYSGGIYVSNVIRGTSAASSEIKQGDVILEIEGNRIDARGNFEHPDYGLLSLSYLVKDTARVGQELKVKVLRDGKEHDLMVKLQRKESGDYLVDSYMFDRGPKYFILGGLLFQELTVPYLELVAGDDWANRGPFKLAYTAKNPDAFETEGRKKIVFLSGVLPSNSTIGYEGLSGLILTKINGRDILSIADVDAAVKEPADGLHKIEFTDFPHLIFLDSAMAEIDNTQTLPNRYRITELKRLD